MASHGFVTAIFLHAGTPVARVLDVSLVIDSLLSPDAPFASMIDPTRIGASGISTGGASVLGATGGWAANGIAADPRIKAMALYEPAANLNTEADVNTITVPYLVMGGLQHRIGRAVPALFAATTEATPRVYVQTPSAAHFSYITGMPDELDQAREQALFADPNMPEPLTALTPTNAAAARAYEIWNWGEILYPALGPSYGGGRNLCDRVGVNSVRSLDLDGDGFTDSPPFRPDDPPYLPLRAPRAEVMIPMIKLYTVAFWKTHLQGDRRYQRFLTPGYAQSHGLDANVFIGE